jgi:hypothetical protein
MQNNRQADSIKVKSSKKCRGAKSKECCIKAIEVRCFSLDKKYQSVPRVNILNVKYKTRHTMKFMQIPCVFYDGINWLHLKCWFWILVLKEIEIIFVKLPIVVLFVCLNQVKWQRRKGKIK